MEQEKYLLCDLKFYKNAKGEIFYYILVYSSLEILEKVFISQEDFEFVVKNKNNINIQDFLFRSYDRNKKAFKVRFKRK